MIYFQKKKIISKKEVFLQIPATDSNRVIVVTSYKS